MTSFTVRVELHEADWKDYDKLHTEMIGQGFVHTIESGDWTVYELPPAEYNFEGNLTKSEVLDRAKTAADRTNRKNAVLVTESNGRTWRGLSKV